MPVIPSGSTQIKVRNLIADALLDIGIGAPGETLEADTMQHGLRTLNRLFSLWSIERLMIFRMFKETFTLTIGDAAYDIGPQGDFVTTRPTRIDTAKVMDGTREWDLKLLTSSEWQAIPDKTISGRPRYLYNDDNIANAELSFFPVPDAAYTLILTGWHQLGGYVDLDTIITLPPGYELAVVSNLSVMLAPSHGKPVAPETVAIALESRASIRSHNVEPLTMKSDEAFNMNGGCIFDINTGEF